MKKRGIYLIVIVIVALIILGYKFNLMDFAKKDNTTPEDGNLTKPECTSDINCPQVSIEKYCENNSAYQRLKEYSCIKGKCVLQQKESELFAVCSEKYECKNGACIPISSVIKNCGAYLTENNGFYKLENDLDAENLTEACITIKGNNITFDCDGNSITGDSNFSGVYSEENKYLTIKNCEISMGESSGIGIYLYNNEHSSILNNKLNDQHTGLRLNWESDAIIKDNSIKSNSFGILLEKIGKSEISNNIVCENTIKDLKITSASELHGINNKFENTDKASDGWPVFEEHYTNCTN